jgi:uncharacterized repeat protein (TIGR02543 family)
MERIMRKCTALLTAGALTLSGLYLSPAHATAVEYSCTTGTTTGPAPTYTVTTGVVSAGADCVGAVIIPEGVSAIGVEAFRGATGLTSITLPAGMTSIGDSAFYLATSLNNVSIPSTVTSIGSLAFYEARELTSIIIPSGVTSIESLTFYGAAKLSSVSFATGSLLTQIKNQAFEKNYILGSITIPAGVTHIGTRAFDEARSLNSVTFASDRTLLSIGYAAFLDAPITNLVIPSSVNSIGAYAFEGTSLTSIYFLSNEAPEMDLTESPFFDIDGTPKAYIREGATGFDPVLFAQSPEVAPLGHGLDVEVGVYSVEYNNQSATTAQLGGSSYYLKGSAITEIPSTPPVKNDHTFTGWFTAASGGVEVTDNSYTPIAPYGAKTLYAKWVIDPAYVAARAAEEAAARLAAEEAAARLAAEEAAAADVAARTIAAKKKFSVKPLAKRVGVTIVSKKATVSFKVAKSSKKICTKSGSKLKTLKAGNCVVTFTVKEPKPKKGKKPKATNTVNTLVVQ